MRKLLATGRTDLLTRFVSRKGRRFKAYLVKTGERKIGFEFEARPARAATAAAEPRSETQRSASQPRPRASAARKAPRAKPAKTSRKSKPKVA